MNISEIFIKRPVMTLLCMLTLAFFGVLSYRALPVSNLPDVDFPTIQVTVNYPGANPQTIASNVVVPLEQQFASIPSLLTISSTSYTNNANIVLRFDLDRNIDLAAPDVQQAISAAGPQLPQNLPYAPVYNKINPTASPILFFVVTSPTQPEGKLYDYSYTILAQHLSMINGVSQVQTYGSPSAVRLRVDPQKLYAKGLGLDTVATAITNANVNIPVGTLFGKTREYTVNASGQLFKAAEFNPTIVKNDNGSIVRFRDIGEAIDSVQNDKIYLKFFDKTSQKPMSALGVRKESGSNALQVIDQVNQLLPSLRAEIPASVEVIRVFDESDYIWESVHDVEFTLFAALILVVLVIFFYLGKVRDTIIPIIVIPLSILGTFIVMFLLGYTIDILSLLAITLAIGYLVDDAVVVLENIFRHIEHGASPLQAALNGSKEISFTILSMTLSLATMFIPLIFMGGIIGRILHELAITIVTAVLFSGCISLSLTPLLCSRFLPPHGEKGKQSRIERFSEAFNQKILHVYQPALEWALHHRFFVLLCGIASLGFSTFLLLKVPKDFLPPDDMGLIEGYVRTVDGTSPFLLSDYLEQLSKKLVQDPNIENITAVGANAQDNQGFMWIVLKPLKERLSLQPLLHHLRKEANTIPGVEVFLKPLPLINLQVGASESRADYQYTLQSLNANDLFKFAPLMEKRMKQLSAIQDVNSDLDITQPQVHIEILRDKASTYNLTAQQIENVLGYAFAATNLSPINTSSYQYYAIMETFPHFYRDPSQLSQLWLRSSTNEMVPLSAVTKVTEDVGPLTINHINGLPSATISFNLAHAPLETAIKQINALAKEILPINVTGSVQGTANIFVRSFANMQFLLMLAMFIIYVILGILYENFFPPFTVMSSLPPAALGGFLSLVVFGMPLSIYAFIGLIMLLGIVMKNGIILIDFANETRLKEGKSTHDAILHASLIRCRPILMTTCAALMGAIPIAVGMGGMTAQSRRPLGIVIVGGLIVSQLMTLFLTPVMYVYIENFHERLKRTSGHRTLKGKETSL